jgi:hypothetical protein
MKHETNEAFIKRLMNYSPAGALGQIFIIDALAKQAKAVAEADPSQLAESWNNGLIHPAAWQEAAKHIHQEMEKKRGAP